MAQRGGESGSADTDESMADVLAWLLKDGASTAGGEQAMSIASLQVCGLRVRAGVGVGVKTRFETACRC